MTTTNTTMAATKTSADQPSAFSEEAWALCGKASAEGSDQDKRHAHVNWQAAQLASTTRGKVVWLRNMLNEALERLDAARTTKQAHLALSWLSNSLMSDILEAKTRLSMFSDMVDGRFELGDERRVTKHLSDVR